MSKKFTQSKGSVMVIGYDHNILLPASYSITRCTLELALIRQFKRKYYAELLPKEKKMYLWLTKVGGIWDFIRTMGKIKLGQRYVRNDLPPRVLILSRKTDGSSAAWFVLEECDYE